MRGKTMKPLKSAKVKASLKGLIGRLAVRLFPLRAKAVEQNIGDASYGLFDRTIRAGLIRSDPSHDKISGLHQKFWAGAEGTAFARRNSSRFESWFLAEHAGVVDAIESLLTTDNGRYQSLYEIGCGDGQVLKYLSTRLHSIDHFVGIDINAHVIAMNNQKFGNNRLEFVCANAMAWIGENSRPCSVFFSNGGVLEYFSKKQLTGLLQKIHADFRPSVFAIIEPVAPDFEAETEIASRPYGKEWSFTHNYRYLFESNGFVVHYHRESRAGGHRWVLMVLRTAD